MAIRLLIVDNCPIRRTALAQALGHTGRYCVTAHSSADEFNPKDPKLHGIHGAMLAVGEGPKHARTMAVADSLHRGFPKIPLLAYAVASASRVHRDAWMSKVNSFLPAVSDLDSLREGLAALFPAAVTVPQVEVDGPAPSFELFALSVREQQLLDMLGHGMCPKTIASTLAISVHTVYSYQDRLRFKLHLPDGERLRLAAIQHMMKGNANADSMQAEG